MDERLVSAMKRRAMDARATRSAGMTLRGRLSAAWHALTGKRTTNTIYDGAAFNALMNDWMTTRTAPDDELRWSLTRLRTRARDLERNNATARNSLRLLANGVIGARGFVHSAEVRNNDGTYAEKINEKIEDAWARWCKRPTCDGKWSMATISRRLLKTVARDGDVFIRLWRGFDNEFSFAFEPIDADQVDELLNAWGTTNSDNSIRMGVEVDPFQRPVAYHVWNRPELATGYGPPRERLRIPAEQIIHLYDPDRIGQSRGVSWFVAAMVPLRHLNGYVESELVAARVAAAKMMFFQRKVGEWGQAKEDPAGAGFVMDAAPGQAGILPEGYEIASWDPSHPNTAFGAFVKDGTRRVATALGQNYNSLAGDLEGVNYSSIKAGLQNERDYYRAVQDWWRDTFLEPLYREWLRMAVVSGALVLDSRDFRKFEAVRFTGRGFPWVDPLKDVEGAILAVQSGLGTRTDFLEEQGDSLEETFETLRQERELAEEYGITVDGPQKQTLTSADTESEDAADAADGGKSDDAKASKNGDGRSNGVAHSVMARARRRF